ncbi:MAG: sensor domain-containing diguanylate cyclase, partial [Gloeocapsa sp. DLM2.Bin57]
LRQRATESPVQPELVEDALRELLFVLEELQTSQEELRQQNQQLIAARHQVELERQNYQVLFELAPDGYLVTNRQGKIYQANQAAAELFSIPKSYLINKPLMVLIHESNRQLFQTLLLTLNQSDDWEVFINKGNGDKRTLALSVTQVKGLYDQEDTLLWLARDITERKLAEAQIHYLAYYDSLTNLPNRYLLLEHLENTFALAKRSYHYGALLFIDLDRFKTINDSCGHDFGDLLLPQVAMRLQQSLRQTDMVARFRGDEFVILLPELSYQQEIAALLSQNIAEKILTSLTVPFMLEQHEVIIGANIGIALFPDGIKSVNELLKHGGTAMSYAKICGRNKVCLFESKMQFNH